MFKLIVYFTKLAICLTFKLYDNIDKCKDIVTHFMFCASVSMLKLIVFFTQLVLSLTFHI